jgi:hypothetical protein
MKQYKNLNFLNFYKPIKSKTWSQNYSISANDINAYEKVENN